MSASYVKPDAETLTLLERMIEENHRARWDDDIDVVVLVRYAPEGGAPLMLHGYPALATVGKASAKVQAITGAEAIITLDGDAWEEHDEAHRAAILDHELEHLERTAKGKVRVRPHDWQLGGFASIAERHGAAAVEVQAIQALADEHGQLLLGAGWTKKRGRAAA